ncbi:hypothetical protein WICANDRAFT_81490 [Wickerhamomyces anomalus NRRL Y-366-8]|uniref:E3 ubiquitin-protein ligase n=1 Tax=Wickerhamomyces anomalus (strain ATCC 58044 / CBS 1984 / NCYC 433 / NRRL Y-366-8) TaxID=683960 RepID=A0A1E3NVX9_WICAA|nr:uncharacterized protein WICANDRAFT_81490 [Wickerhamomyces anomalus NRRL Y-366-8]ODQ57274.1 hypothetical protein WICANDRAFT_81490 [Wickerhamomyces anomalus NRRL Y-366-8]
MMTGLTSQDHRELLKKYLVHLPHQFHYDFSDAARIDLRRALYYAAADGGRYIRAFFPDVDEDQLPTYAQVLMPDKCHKKCSQEFYLKRGENVDPRHPNRSCGRKFKKGEPVYRCVTCGHDESSGLCLNCYNEKFHKGHDVIMSICQREFGGVCDCGDPEAWKSKVHCDHFDVEETSDSDFPIDFKNSLYDTIEIVLDYIVDVMAGSSSSILKGIRDSPAKIIEESQRSTLLYEKYKGQDWNSEKFYLLLYNDQNKQYRDAIQRVALTTEKVLDFATMVADEVHQHGRAKVIGSSDIETLLNAQKTLEATGLSSCIRSARDIFREEMCADMVQWLTDIANGSISGNYNVSRDLLLRAVCSPWNTGVSCYPIPEGHPIGFLDLDMIPNVAISSRDSSNPKSENWKFTPTSWNVDGELANECGYDVNFSFNHQDKKSFHGSKFQYLLFFDIRYWKSFRVDLHNLFSSVLTANLTYRPLLCCQYLDIYPTMLELFFLHDREPESSCMTSMNQILTPFGTATMIADHGDLTRLLAAAYSFLTSLSVRRPCDVDTSMNLAPTAFKNRKVGQVFFDICCILLKSDSVENILTSQFINQVCDILELFQGRPTLEREAVEHVEYESTDYGLYFNIYSVISSLSEMVAKTFLKPNNKSTPELITVAFSRLLILLHSNQGSNGSSDITDLIYKNIDTLEGKLNVTDFKVHSSKVSFLHPMHAFLTWIVQYSGITDLAQLDDNFRSNSVDEMARVLVEHPLRVIVMLSQIKIGFWVRNGFSIRTQLHIYKGSGIRESGYRRDLFMIQFLASIANSEMILMSMFSRWSLLPWLKEDFGNHDDYDAAELPLMVEECLLFFIHLLSQTSYYFDPTEVIDQRLSTEIIHALCFQPLTYSKLCSEVPDFLVHEKRFDLVLKKVANYEPPLSSNQSGIYKLKEELFSQVDPYYIHYNSNKREEAEKAMKERISKKKKVPSTETFITPSLKSLENTVFKDLFRFTSSKNFVQFLKSTLKYVNNEGIAKTDTMLNFALHLIHIAIEGRELKYSREFSENIWSELTADHNEPFYYESVGSLLYKFLKDDDYGLHHSKIREIFRTLKDKDRTVDSYLKEQVQSFDASILGSDFLSPPPTASSEFERKKILARERRAKIMAKFKQQQCQFVEKNKLDGDGNDTDTDADMVDNDEEVKGWLYPEEHCILCQMPKGPDEFFGVVFNASASSSARTVPFEDKYWTLKAFDESNHDNPKLSRYYDDVRSKHVIGPAFPMNEHDCTLSSVVASSCGHGMHYSCYQNYLVSTRSRQTQITRTVPEDFENLEFICPLCKSLGNLFVPILWTHNNRSLKEFLKPQENWHAGFDSLRYSSFSDSESELTHILADDALSSLKSQYKSLILQNTIPKALRDITSRISKRIGELSQPHFREYLTKLISNTISSTEIALRRTDSEINVASKLSNQTLTTLRILVEFKKTWFAILSHYQHHKLPEENVQVKVADECLGKLAYLSSDKVFEVFDDLDFFEMLVSCVPSNNISDNSIQRLCYTGLLIQIIATLLSQLKGSMFDEKVGLFDLSLLEVSENTSSNILGLARQIRDNHPVFDNLPDEVFEDVRFPNLLYTLLVHSITPFLRKVSIWCLASCANLDSVDLDQYYEDDSEAIRLAKFLNLPTVEEQLELFNQPETVENSKFSGFVQYIQTTDNDLRFSKLEYPGLVKLIDIPKRLDDIFTKIIYVKPEFKSIIGFDPAVCLFCGKIVNLQKSAYEGNKGECNNHYENECLNDFGMFLLPKHSSILLLHKGNGSFHPAPYIDSHGEYDSDARQGQILTLSEDKYDNFIKQMWLQHDTQNYVTRKLEGTLDIGGWETL